MLPGFSLFLAFGITADLPAAPPPLLPPGHYEAKALGEDGLYRFTWDLNPDSTYVLKMTARAAKGKKSHLRGRYAMSGDSLYLKGTSVLTGEEWKPYPDDVYTVQRMNDTTYHVVIMQDNEVTFTLKSKAP